MLIHDKNLFNNCEFKFELEILNYKFREQNQITNSELQIQIPSKTSHGIWSKVSLWVNKYDLSIKLGKEDILSKEEAHKCVFMESWRFQIIVSLKISHKSIMRRLTWFL